MNLMKTFVHNPVQVTVADILRVMFGILALVSLPLQVAPEVRVISLAIEWT